MSFLIDCHAHLYDEKIVNNIEEIISKCKNNNVKAVICAGSDIESSAICVELAKKYDIVYACVGVHPENCDDVDFDKYIDTLKQLSNCEKVVGIGEIGLDYYWRTDNKETQQKIFVKQLKLAHDLKLPIQIHNRNATGDVLAILNNNKSLLAHGGIIHCFNGSNETLKTISDLGLKISIGGVLTFNNSKNLQTIISGAPKDLVLLETDSPYLTPEPFRGNINDSSNIFWVGKKLAELWDMDLKQVEDITYQNTINVFKRIKYE